LILTSFFFSFWSRNDCTFDAGQLFFVTCTEFLL
jgi:hypothetical protein